MAPAFVSLLLLAVSARALTLGAASHRELSRDTVVSLDTISFLANRHLGLRRHRHRRRQSVECVHKPESAPGPSPSQVPTSGSYEQPTSSSTSITHTSTTTSDLDHAATTTSTTHTHSATLTQAKPPPPQASPTSTKAAAPPANTVVSGGGGRTPFGSFFAGNNTGGDGTAFIWLFHSVNLHLLFINRHVLPTWAGCLRQGEQRESDDLRGAVPAVRLGTGLCWRESQQ